jgi:hypothetical protein
MYYVTSIPGTVSELFDSEIVIANYRSGLYYSISPSGSLIWQALRAGKSVEDVSGWLASHFTNQAGELSQIVTKFVGTLISEGLIIEGEPETSPGLALPNLSGQVFEAPLLERFDDLQELLLLDPVHDVDQAGWPRRAPE